VDDEGTGGGPEFDSVDAGYGFGVQGVGSETVDGFGGEGDKAAGAEEPDGVVNFAGIGGAGHKRL
jgi:hypothetical protein